MSGVDNMRGLDYQVNFSLLKLLEILLYDTDNVESIQFESLTENEEDMNIYKKDGSREYLQIKKRSEGYNWSPSNMKDIFEKFHEKDKDCISFVFVTNGSANIDVVDLKDCINNDKIIEQELISKFTTNNLDSKSLTLLLKKTTLLTRCYSTDNDEIPGKIVKENIFKLLHSINFTLLDSDLNIYNSLWMYIYELSEKCINNKLTNIINDLELRGLKYKKINNSLPDTSNFLGRTNEIDIIQNAIFDIRKVIIKGISGIGKSSIIAKLANVLNEQNFKVCWIEIDSLHTVSSILSKISNSLYLNGLEHEAGMITKKEISEQIPFLCILLEKFEVFLLIDSIDKGNLEVRNFIENLIKHINDRTLTGALICSTVDTIESYSEIDIINKRIFEYHLMGFNDEDAQEIFSGSIEVFSQQNIIDFNMATGGYPLSIFFLKELLSNNDITKNELLKLKELSIVNSNKWLLHKTYENLSKEEQDIILAASIFNYPFLEIEIEQIIETISRPKYLLDKLVKKNIIIYIENKYFVHDSISILLHDILVNNVKKQYHTQLTNHYRLFMEDSYKKGKSVLYTDIMKWGYHLENSNILSKEQVKIVSLEPKYIDALWAIMRFGFPFAYSDTNCIEAYNITRDLRKLKFIKKNYFKHNSYISVKKKYILNKINYFDKLFIEYLCLSREISNHLGYISIFEQNEAFANQGLFCHWEHCVEYMPLPPLKKTKSEYEERINFLKQMFDSGAYDEKPEEVRNMLLEEMARGIPGDVPDVIEQDEKKEGCPIFGHYCPGGKEKAAYCRSMDSE